MRSILRQSLKCFTLIKIFDTIELMKTLKDLKAGDDVYVLVEYNLCKAIFIKLNKKSVKVKYQYQDFATNEIKFREVYEPIDKSAHPEEKIAVVWEMWRGTNGRGGYRLDKTMYPTYHREAKLWPHQALLNEQPHGNIVSDSISSKEKNQDNLRNMLKGLQIK